MLFSLLICWSTMGHTQKRPIQYHGGAYQVYTLKENGMQFKLFDFAIGNTGVRAMYFGKNGKRGYDTWRRQTRPSIMCYLAVGFSKEFEQNQPPLGLCIDQGNTLNRALDPVMDGLVSISRDGHLSAIDIDREQAQGRYNLRNARDKANFLSRISQNKSSVFQTQLMYSASEGSKMGELKHGKRASRRFLAICRDQQGQMHHIIVDLVASVHLNHAASNALAALQKKGYEVEYLLNQDTGARNIMTAYDQRGKKIYSAPVDISKATQLLVYYWHG